MSTPQMPPRWYQSQPASYYTKSMEFIDTLIQQYAPANYSTVVKDHFTYTAQLTSVAAGTTSNFNIKIQADSHFVIMSTTAAVFDTASPAVFSANPNALIGIKDSGSGRDLQDSLYHILNMFGTGQRPYWLNPPKLIKANATVVISVTNQETAARTYFINLNGFKVFYV